VALVLGAAVWPGGVPSPTLQRRALKGAELVLTGSASALIACGGLGKHGPSEAQVIKDICRAAGVPAERIHLEDRSTSTEENIRFALPILARLKTERVFVVTDRYHSLRAVLVARRFGLNAIASPTTLHGTTAHRIVRAYLREAFALAKFFITGLFNR
jgi:uncharacterized SAM-binding protein YcdF (DUF218 family)